VYSYCLVWVLSWGEDVVVGVYLVGKKPRVRRYLWMLHAPAYPKVRSQAKVDHECSRCPSRLVSPEHFGAWIGTCLNTMPTDTAACTSRHTSSRWKVASERADRWSHECRIGVIIRCLNQQGTVRETLLMVATCPREDPRPERNVSSCQEA